MKRCNKPAMWYSPQNGFRLCRECWIEHPQSGMVLCADAGPEPFGRCDQPAETREQFDKRTARNKARRDRDQLRRDLGLVKVRGNLGGTYWE